MHRIKVVIMKLANELLELCRILVQMDVCHFIRSKTYCHPLCLLPLLLGLLLLLYRHLSLSLGALDLLGDSIDLVLHGILLLDHLSLEGNVESPLVIFLVLVELLQ